MSAGRFVRSRYSASYDANMIHPIRVQPETLAASLMGTPSVVNSPTTEDVNNPISASISLSNRSLGLRPRFLNLQLPEAATPPTGYAPGSITRIPAVTQAFFDNVPDNSRVIYLGVEWEVVSKETERAR
jgi:hypothetical protein